MITKQYNVLQTCKCKSHSNYVYMLTSRISVHRMLLVQIHVHNYASYSTHLYIGCYKYKFHVHNYAGMSM